MSNSHDGQEFVCHGAPCRCDKGSVPSPLQVTSQRTVFLQGKLWATVLDKPVAPFGTCALQNGNPCVPALLAWEGYRQGLQVGADGGFPLLEKSTVRCAVGGVVSILRTLQIAVPGSPATPAQAESLRTDALSLNPLLAAPDDDEDDEHVTF